MVNPADAEKRRLRAFYLQALKRLSPSRKRQAADASLSLVDALAGYAQVLSFASLASEIDTTELNRLLASQGKLLLPRIEGHALRVFRVTRPDEELALSSWGILEPTPALCHEDCLSASACILTPGLAFDLHGSRLGRGGGFYDRFLAHANATAWGLGFAEQMHNAPLPREAHDRLVERQLLF